jgi:uncharacterized OB-fold protein
MPVSDIEAYYEGLEKGTLMARHCTRCGKYTFPPTGCCEHCGSFSVQWSHLSGRGKLLFATHNVAPACHPRFEKIAPYVYGQFRLDEGIIVQAILTGVEATPEALRKLYERGEVPVVAKPMKMDDLPVLAFAEAR